MTANNDPIGKKLGLSPLNSIFTAEPSTAVSKIIDDANDDSVKADFEYARGNIKKLIEDGNDAIDQLSQIAEQSQNPRAYEVLGTIFATMLKANQDLMDLQKKTIDLKKQMGQSTSQQGPKTVTNNLFVGTTKDLDEALETLRKNKE